MTLKGEDIAFEIVSGAPSSALLLLCDHASNRLPERYGDLGLPAAQFRRHIAYDIGARDLTLGLAARLDGTAILTHFSRLLIDPNRGEDDPTLIMKLSDGAVVPGNTRVDEAERAHRIGTYHAPYHAAIRGETNAIEARGRVPIIVSIHSFTPSWRGTARPWHIGLLWDRDDRLVGPMLRALRLIPGVVVGDNEPYSGSLAGDTLNTHATARGLPHVLIEIRQDLVQSKSGVDEWTERLAQVLEPIMKNVSLHPNKT